MQNIDRGEGREVHQIIIVNNVANYMINRTMHPLPETCVLAISLRKGTRIWYINSRARRISHCVILQQKAATLMQNAELEPRFQGSAQQLFTVGVVVVWGGGFRACAQLRARTATYRVLVLAARISTRVQSMRMFLRLIIL